MARQNQSGPFGRFDFDLAGGVQRQLIRDFETHQAGAMDEATIGAVDADQGVYQLFHDTKLVYVGKARNLRKRLGEHRWNLAGRQKPPAPMNFKCLSVHKNWVPSVHEDILIGYFTRKGLCEWNRTGFGNHDPGRNREKTDKPPQGFDTQYPINSMWPCEIAADEYNARDLLMAIKDALPYTLRYQTDNPKQWQRGSAKYNGLTVRVSRDGMPLEELLQEIKGQFPPGWQATVFPSHVIFYEEDEEYQYGRRI
jgi:hypothetical protein